jgi:hypothetical protein
VASEPTFQLRKMTDNCHPTHHPKTRVNIEFSTGQSGPPAVPPEFQL